MNQIIRFWNQNRKGIIIGIIAVVLVIVIIQVLNGIAKRENEEKNNRPKVKQEENLPTKSIIGSGSVNSEKTKTNVEIIEKFIEECNMGNISNAYAMLTNECKEVLFPKEENFKNGYYNIVFKSKKLSTIENFISTNNRYTYQVKLYNDILSSGNAQDTGYFQDYITIDEKSENGKLNINNFIYKKDIDKQTEKDGIKVTVLAQEIYKDNEKYQIKIENATDKRISINTGKYVKSIYLLDNNNTVYGSNISEISSTLYEIPINMARNYKLKFNKIYSAGMQANAIVFSDIVADYIQYKQTPDEENKRVQITVNL